MDKEFFDHIYSMKKLINEVANGVLIIDCAEKIDGGVYDGNDLVNGSLIFNHIASNIIITKMLKDGLDILQSSARIEEYGRKLRELIQEYTGLDIHDIIQDLYRGK